MNVLKFILLLLMPFTLFSQNKVNDSIASKIFYFTKAQYKDFVVSKNRILGITKYDSLVIWNSKRDKVDKVTRGISAITGNDLTGFFCTTNNGKIMKSQNGKRWKVMGNFKGKVYKILNDEDSNPIVVSELGFYYKGEFYMPPIDSPFYRGNYNRSFAYMRKPDLFFLDKEQRIWMAFNDGEFGGDGYFFDLNTKEFYSDNSLELLFNLKYPDKVKGMASPLMNDLIKEFPENIKITVKDTLFKFPKSVTLFYNTRGITQDASGNFYMSNSLMHFFLDGSIHKISKSDFPEFYSNKEIKLLDEVEHWVDSGEGEKKWKMAEITEYLGPIEYNRYDNHIYYYTDKGFFKIIESNGSYSKELILKPHISWTHWQTNAIGSQMNVIKFEFIDKGKFIFLTSNNGIGYYTGEELKYYN